MVKVSPVRFDKVWGYELFLYSCLPGRETVDTNGKKPTNGPLVKIIRTEDRLSVQVHPDDQMALALEGQKNGKSESWYVLRTFKPAPQVVVGLKDYDEKKVRAMLAEGRFEDNLVFTGVKAGDFINVPAGMVHGLGGGIEVLEVQQPSDTTYRYYDYNRLENGKPRPLHLEKALKCQKRSSHLLNPTNNNPLTYVNEVCTQTFLKQPRLLTSDAIVVDLTDYSCHVARAGEQVNLTDYVLIQDERWHHPG